MCKCNKKGMCLIVVLNFSFWNEICFEKIDCFVIVGVG